MLKQINFNLNLFYALYIFKLIFFTTFDIQLKIEKWQ